MVIENLTFLPKDHNNLSTPEKGTFICSMSEVVKT